MKVQLPTVYKLEDNYKRQLFKFGTRTISTDKELYNYREAL